LTTPSADPLRRRPSVDHPLRSSASPQAIRWPPPPLIRFAAGHPLSAPPPLIRFAAGHPPSAPPPLIRFAAGNPL